MIPINTDVFVGFKWSIKMIDFYAIQYHRILQYFWSIQDFYITDRIVIGNRVYVQEDACIY